MIKVKNSKVISELSRKSLKSNKLRNVVAIIAIAMTAILFTALFTIGGSMMKSMQEATMRQVGTSSHAGFKFLSQSEYDVLKNDSKVKDISYNIIIGFGENEELNKTYTEIRYTEPKAAEWSFSMPTTGTLPKEKLDIATSTAVLDALGVPHELGQMVHLEFTSNGEKYSQDFKLCGFWESDIVLGANQAFLSKEYCDSVAPTLTEPYYKNSDPNFDGYAGTINPSLWFSTSWNIEGQVNKLMERCNFDQKYVNDGVNWAYASAELDAQSIILLLAIIVLVLLSGYLIIYNIFYISVSNDIRFYGLLKTIGTTGRQLKRIVIKQAQYLCIVGIPFGLVLGWLVGKLLVPIVLKTSVLNTSIKISCNPMVFVFSAIFALLTVFISCIKPCKIAAKVSPIEAVRWSGVNDNIKKKGRKAKKVTPYSMALAGLHRERKKAVVVMISLSLSMVLLNATYTVVKGFDMDKFLENKVVTDFLVTDATLRNGFSQFQELSGVTDTVVEEISAYEGLEKTGAVWMREYSHKLSDKAYDNTIKILDKNKEEMNWAHAEGIIDTTINEHTMYSHIYGVDETLWDNIEIYDGNKLDKEKFASGDYVIATSFWDNGKDRFYDIGDKVEIDFGNGKTKEYTVLNIGNIPYALGPQHGHLLDIYFTLPASEYNKMIGKTQPMTLGFNVDEEHTKQAEASIKSYCENVEPSLDYESKSIYVEEFKNEQLMFSIVGGAVSIILGLIGVLNFINAILTSIISRKRELAMLQSIGMTGIQLKKMLVFEGINYALFTILFTITLGNIISYVIVNLIAGQIWFFSYHFTILPILICAPIILVISLIIPILANKAVSKQTIVERLRESE